MIIEWVLTEILWKYYVALVENWVIIEWKLQWTTARFFLLRLLAEITRRSENDNTPQPLDQWTNSPFIGQQVGNCKSFTLTHYLTDIFAMHRGPRSILFFTQHLSNSHAFHSKWVKLPIAELQQFPYFTLKIQGQGHGWGQSLKSQCESNILSTHIHFIPFQSAIPFLR